VTNPSARTRAARGVLIAGLAVLTGGCVDQADKPATQQSAACEDIRELLDEVPRDPEKIDRADRANGWSEPGSSAFANCNADAYEVRRIVDDLAEAQAQETSNTSSPTPSGPGAGGGTLTDLVTDLQGAGVDCTDWVTFDTTGSNRVIDSTASGMCRDQGITIALYQGGSISADDAARDRADRGASLLVWGADWLVMFDHTEHYRAFAKYVDAS
jgi:hypothetical protein